MHISLIKRAAVLGASAFALAASAAFSAEWTSFRVGTLNSYTFTYAHRDDGQFILGEGGEIGIQTTYGSPGITPLANTSNILLDPAAIAVKNSTVGIIGAGGPLATSNLYPFDPSTPATSINATPLANLQNYVIKYWKHPTSGREGWLIIGGNGTVPPGGFYGANTLSFVSLDGSKKGNITGDLCEYSAGLDVDSQGNVFFALSGYESPDEGKILKFTAAQVDTAVQALINDTPAPLSTAVATLIFQADASSSIAVDSAGRFWASGYQISHIQAYDPVTSVQRRFTPDHAALAGASGPTSYSVRSYNRNDAGFVSFLASDSFYNGGSALTLGYKPVSELNIRSVQFAATTRTVTEAAGNVDLTITITPAPTTKVTVPVTVSGTATKGKDYTIATTSLTFDANNTSRIIPVKVINDIEDEDNNNETVIVTLGEPKPVAHAGFGALGTEKFTLTITDDDLKPQVAAVQNFGTLKVGSPVSYQVINTGTPSTKWTASGLPAGLKIDPRTGIISGMPTTADEYDQVWITATNAHGVSTSIAFVLNVAAFPAPAVGTFIGLVDRVGTVTNGLGARVNLVTTSKSTYSGKIEIGKTSVTLKGNLNNTDANPKGSAAFKVGTTNLTLNFTLDAITGELAGTLVPTVVAPPPPISGAAIVDASLRGWRAQTSTALTGLHNFFAAVPGGPASSTVPEGTSYGSAKVATTGITTIAGVAADGSAFTSSSPLAINGDLIVYQVLYKVQGSFMGVLTIANDTAHTMSGAITWSKPSQGATTTDKLYATGWSSVESLEVRGGKYRPAVGATLPMNAAVSAGNNARIVLQDGGIEALGANPTNIQFRIASATSLVVPAPHKLTLKNDTGLFTGSITLGTGTAKKTFNIQALLVPDTTTPDPFDSTAEGYFILPESSTVSRAGMVGIEPVGL